ncbi:hypothetical protein MMC14_008446 [Varicellaria rhodocarpa]|nr:hypothetical protein [Varicellaria rhodocarpa]
MWDTVNTKDEDKVKVIILEGWCIGFSALGRVEVKSRWEQAGEEKQQDKYGGRLGYSGLENLQFVDQALERYSVLTDQFHALVYIDAEETRFVYEWRLEQEAMLRSTTGNGMTDEQVLRFVDGYYSSYELYSDGLRAGVFLGGEGGGKAQLTMTVGKDRRVKDVKVVDSDKKIH